jgi:uncharacterized protein
MNANHNHPHPPFLPPAGMANPHVQTVLSSVGRKLWQPKHQANFHQKSSRRIYTLDGVKLAVDLNIMPDTPLVMIIPGWLGSSTSSYVLSAGSALAAQGFSVARINLRDHGSTAHLNAGLFNSALIDEVIALTTVLSDEHGQAGAGLLGYSLGGNFALRVSRSMSTLPTLAVCPAIAPANTMYRIDRNLIYQRYFVRKWRKVWLEKQAAFPDHYDFKDALSLNTVSALTDYFVKYHSRFNSTAEYFDAYDLSGMALHGVNAHILAAIDDPIIPADQYQTLPGSLTLDLTPQGGHGAYLDSWDLSSWADQYAVRYFQNKTRLS